MKFFRHPISDTTSDSLAVLSQIRIQHSSTRSRMKMNLDFCGGSVLSSPFIPATISESFSKKNA